MVHIEKVNLKDFEELVSGTRTVDIRKEKDKSYSVGDRLLLCEYNQHSDSYTNRACTVQITHVKRDSPALQQGYVALSVQSLVHVEREQLIRAAKAWRIGVRQKADDQRLVEPKRDEHYAERLKQTMELARAVDSFVELEQAMTMAAATCLRIKREHVHTY